MTFNIDLACLDPGKCPHVRLHALKSLIQSNQHLSATIAEPGSPIRVVAVLALRLKG